VNIRTYFDPQGTIIRG